MLIEYSPLDKGENIIDVYVNIKEDDVSNISDRMKKRGWVLYDIGVIDGLWGLRLMTKRNLEADFVYTFIHKDELERTKRMVWKFPESYKKRTNPKKDMFFDKSDCYDRDKDVIRWQDVGKKR